MRTGLSSRASSRLPLNAPQPGIRRLYFASLVLGLGLSLLWGPAFSESLPEALVRAYQGHAQLNAERARQRATDEGVPQALAAYRPQLNASLSAGLFGVRNLLPEGEVQSATLRAWSAGVTASQTLFNGFRTGNSVRQAESQVFSGRETLRNVEQSVFLDVVTAYANVFAGASLVEAQRVNVQFLRETLAATRKRHELGDVTPTDVAQAEARFSRGLADLNAAEVQFAVNQATYAQVVGSPPGRLVAAEPVDHLLPPVREQAVAIGRREHPAVVAASYDVDAAQYAIKIAEGSLYPTVTLQGQLSRNVNTDTSLTTARSDVASVTTNANVPIYDGGLAASQVRQGKDQLAQIRALLDRARTQIQTAVMAGWVTNEGAKVAINAAQSEVRAADIALAGVQRETRAGQRTTLDVLNAQQDLVAARARLIQAQRDRVIASYTLLAAIGRLDHARLSLNTPDYAPQTHYHQVRDAWRGLRTPAGQ